jgi:hypothetical protein
MTHRHSIEAYRYPLTCQLVTPFYPFPLFLILNISNSFKQAQLLPLTIKSALLGLNLYHYSHNKLIFYYPTPIRIRF